MARKYHWQMNCGRASRSILAVLTKLRSSSSTKTVHNGKNLDANPPTSWLLSCAQSETYHRIGSMSKQHLEVMLAALLALELIQEPEARCTHRALLLVEYPIAVDLL